MIADIVLPECAYRMDTEESRDIYFVDGCVMKFDTWSEVIDWQCFAEWGLWSIIEEQDKKYFVPILEAGYGWVKQPYIENLITPIDQDDMYYNIICPLAAKYGLIDIQDDKNWGIDPKTGQPVIFDYGVLGYGMIMQITDKMREIGYPG